MGLLGQMAAGAVGGGAEAYGGILDQRAEARKEAAAARLKDIRKQNLERIKQINREDMAEYKSGLEISEYESKKQLDKKYPDKVEKQPYVNESGKFVGSYRPNMAPAASMPLEVYKEVHGSDVDTPDAWKKFEIEELNATVKSSLDAAGVEYDTNDDGRVTTVKDVSLKKGQIPEVVQKAIAPFESRIGKKRKNKDIWLIPDKSGTMVDIHIGGVKPPGKAIKYSGSEKGKTAQGHAKKINSLRTAAEKESYMQNIDSLDMQQKVSKILMKDAVPVNKGNITTADQLIQVLKNTPKSRRKDISEQLKKKYPDLYADAVKKVTGSASEKQFKSYTEEDVQRTLDIFNSFKTKQEKDKFIVDLSKHNKGLAEEIKKRKGSKSQGLLVKTTQEAKEDKFKQSRTSQPVKEKKVTVQGKEYKLVAKIPGGEVYKAADGALIKKSRDGSWSKPTERDLKEMKFVLSKQRK